jgi:hypothetical protein
MNRRFRLGSLVVVLSLITALAGTMLWTRHHNGLQVPPALPLSPPVTSIAPNAGYKVVIPEKRREAAPARSPYQVPIVPLSGAA